MSVLIVTNDSDNDIQNQYYEHIYQQIKQLKYNSSSIKQSLSIVINNPKYSYYQRRYRPQQCLVKHYLFTYMLTLLFLTNHFHWSLIFLTLSSTKFMSTYASLTTTSTISSNMNENEQQCLPITNSTIDRICSKICHAQKNPYENMYNIRQLFIDSYYFPFCSNRLLNSSIHQVNLSLNENQCREIFKQLIKFDEEARKASKLFAIYMQSIDSASNHNRYSIINSDCQQAYKTWACSVKIPYFHRNRLIPPCQTICDEVERVCPTFRPSEREPLFAGQPLFICNGGIVSNSDYGQRPYCFDTCHLIEDYHSVSLSSEKSSYKIRPVCFEIELLSPSPSEQYSLSINDTILNFTINSSINSSATSIISFISSSSIIVNILTIIFMCSFII